MNYELLTAAILVLIVVGGGVYFYNEVSKPMNVIIVSVDALRYDYAERMSIKEKYFYYAQDYKQAVTAASYTPPSLASILTGLYPYNHKCHLMGQPLDYNTTLLSEVLRNNGYYTGAIVAVNIINKLNFNQGWDSWMCYNKLPYKQADYVTDEALKLLDNARNSGRPYYLWIHYFDPHIPFRAPDKHYPRYDKRKDYAAEVNFVDYEIGRFLEEVDFSNTIVVFTSDHGWGLWMTLDGVEKGLPSWRRYGNHYQKLFEEQLHVPLWVHIPYLKPEEIFHQVRTVDIFPTILDSVFVTYVEELDGQSLIRPENEIQPTYSETYYPSLNKKEKDVEKFGNQSLVAVRYRGLKIICIKDTDDCLLFNLKNDPMELNPLDKVIHEYEYTMLYDILRYHRKIDSTEDILRGLGYMV
jgi:arylsulfatase A-like enzyme